MKRSVNAWTFPKELTFEECLNLAEKCGFDAVEFNLDRQAEGQNHAFTLESTDEEVRKVKELAIAHGIETVSISSSLHGGYWGSAKQEDIEYINKVLKKQLDIAKIMGADTILVVPGGMNFGYSLAEARKNSLVNLKNAEDIIRRSGVKVGLENVWNGFFLSPYDMISFLDELDSDVFALYFDLGNMVAFSNSEYWAEIVGSRTAKIHIKDFKRNGGINCGGSFCDLLKGDLDFKAAMTQLKHQGFDGYLTAEVSNSDPNMSTEDYLREIIRAEDIIRGYYDTAK